MKAINYFKQWYFNGYKPEDHKGEADEYSANEMAVFAEAYHQSELKSMVSSSNVSVSDLIIERRQYILDEIWSCKETDLTDDEVDTLDEKMDRDMSVLQWLHSR